MPLQERVTLDFSMTLQSDFNSLFHDYGYTHVMEIGLLNAKLVPWPENHSVTKPKPVTAWELP